MNENQSMKRESKSEFIKRNRQLAKWKAGNNSFQSVVKTCRVCISAIPPTLMSQQRTEVNMIDESPRTMSDNYDGIIKDNEERKEINYDPFDLDEYDVEIWVGTREEHRKAWNKHWAKSN